MNSNPNSGLPAAQGLQHIVIVGGGTAGWMAAAALSKIIKQGTKITLIESDAISTVGVGEATIPEIRKFNMAIGVDENEFLRETGGTFKLGIEFVDWNGVGSRYIHPFGKFGTEMGSVPFFHYWQKLWQAGQVEDLSEFSLAVQASYTNKFMRPIKLENSPLEEIAYAFHFDAGLYAKFLRKHAEARGVVRCEGTIVEVMQHAHNGYISGVRLASGLVVEGDFFMDCSGFRALLIGQTLNVGYEDWSEYLPCNSAVTAPSEPMDTLPPYTQATAKKAGWQWRIPLQHRTGNGYVYCNQYISDQEAEDELVRSLGDKIVGSPRKLQFTTGRRVKCWEKNCIALGLASGFMEPLESTSIHLVHEAIGDFITLMPTANIEQSLVDKFNTQLQTSYTNIRDFLVLHYVATAGRDSEFWRYCQSIKTSDRLSAKLRLYQEGGRIFRDENELFGEASWLAVLHGQKIKAQTYHPVVDSMTVEEVARKLTNIKKVIALSANEMPLQKQFIERFCKTTITL